MKNNEYVKLLNASKVGAKDFGINTEEKALLEAVAYFQCVELPLTVTELMNLSHLGSPATLHRRLDTLLIYGLVNLEYEDGNRRTKYVMLTEKSEQYFSLMDDYMKRLNGSRKGGKV